MPSIEVVCVLTCSSSQSTVVLFRTPSTLSLSYASTARRIHITLPGYLGRTRCKMADMSILDLLMKSVNVIREAVWSRSRHPRKTATFVTVGGDSQAPWGVGRGH
jgi:hypothetical protein